MTKTHTPKTRPTLEEAQAMVGGWVVMAINTPDIQVLVDEDGLSKELEFNAQASQLCGQELFGNAIFLKGAAMWIDDEEEA
jgi:hypothetical protein